MARKLTMKVRTKMTLQEGVEEFMLNCEARNLRWHRSGKTWKTN